MLGHGRKQVLSVAVTVAAVYYDDSHKGVGLVVLWVAFITII